MKRTLLQIALSFSLLILFVGCSLDRAQIISQQSSAKPGDTISVLFTDIYLILSNTKTISSTYARDSLHVGYGLPAGWKVLSSDYYVASGIHMNKLLSIMSDTNAVAKMLQDSLATYAARKTAMTKDNGWSGYFTGKAFFAHNAGMDSIPVPANAVGQWLAYSSKISLSYAGGTATDTGFAIDSLPIDNSSKATATTFFDSVYVKSVPIICFARIIVPPSETTDTLYYFTKTGPKPANTNSPLNYDIGNMTYAPITISNANSVMVPASFTQYNGLWNVSLTSARSLNDFVFSVHANAPWTIRLFDMSGKSMGPEIISGAGATQVRFAPSVNQTILAGSYIVKLESGSGNAAKTIRIVRQ